jgi:hypothetical protein
LDRNWNSFAATSSNILELDLYSISTFAFVSL